MKLLLRILAVLLTFLGVGFATMHVLIARGVARGTPEYELRLGGAMGGLFVGGASACLVGLALLLSRARRPTDEDQEPDQES